MEYLGIFAYCGICSEYYGLEQTSFEFYNEINLADGWIYNTNINDSYLDKVNNSIKSLKNNLLYHPLVILKMNRYYTTFC